MPAKSSQAASGGFTVAERTAMRQRAAELRAEGKAGAKKADVHLTGADARMRSASPTWRSRAAGSPRCC
jgi:hypothetical protein